MTFIKLAQNLAEAYAQYKWRFITGIIVSFFVAGLYYLLLPKNFSIQKR